MRCVTDGTLRSADGNPRLHNVHGSASSVKRELYNVNWSTVPRVVSSSGKVGIASQGSSEAAVTFGTAWELTDPQDAPSVVHDILPAHLVSVAMRWTMIMSELMLLASF